MDSVRSGPFGQIFKPDNFVFGKISSVLSSKAAAVSYSDMQLGLKVRFKTHALYVLFHTVSYFKTPNTLVLRLQIATVFSRIQHS